MSAPLYRIGECVVCRHAGVRPWHGRVMDRQPEPGHGRDAGTEWWAYLVSFTTQFRPVRGETIWLPEDCLSGYDEEGWLTY